ncbi:MAG TPA: NAD(P)-dependent oxidoreductase [Verrucomicrobiae bacterium]|jgi:nucleoside-diphosphate-sugar epimerase
MKILFTGASSFTGFWFVKALAAAGHEIVCPITREPESYTGTRGRRIELLKQFCRFVPQSPFGSDNFLKLARAENFDLLCHHAADVTNYKSAGFDAQAALQNNTRNLPAVLPVLRERGLKSVVLTGTYFEAGEGAGDKPLRNFSPYSLSKTLTFDSFLAECRKAGLPLGKFVIPNPFGPLEEPRFTAFLMKNWQAGKPVEVKTPDYLRDNIHADLLAAVYAKFAVRVANAKEPLLKINPSGYIEKQGGFAQRVAREVKARTDWPCELKLLPQEDFSEPLQRFNTEPATQFAPDWSEPKAWDNLTEFYSQQK